VSSEEIKPWTGFTGLTGLRDWETCRSGIPAALLSSRMGEAERNPSGFLKADEAEAEERTNSGKRTGMNPEHMS